MRVIPREGQVYFDSDDLRFAQRVFPGIRSLSSHFVWDPVRWLPNEHAFFSLVREPVKRTASTYQYKIAHDRFKGEANVGSKEHFAKWIADPQNQDFQIRQIAGEPDLDRAKDVVSKNFFLLGLTERMQESVDALAKLSPLPLNIEPPSPWHKKDKAMDNRAPDNSIKNMLLEDAEARGLLESGNRFDIAFYDWVVAEMFPEYLERAAKAEPRPVPGVPAANYQYAKFINNVVYAPAQRVRLALKGQKEEKKPVF